MSLLLLFYPQELAGPVSNLPVERVPRAPAVARTDPQAAVARVARPAATPRGIAA